MNILWRACCSQLSHLPVLVTGGRHAEGNEHTQSTQRSCSYLRLWLALPESTPKAELGAVWVGPMSWELS